MKMNGEELWARHRRTETTGRGVNCSESGSLGALRHGLPLAVPALHGLCVDVSRRLHPRGILGSTFGGAERSFCGLAELGCFAGSYPAGFDSEERGRIT